MKTSTLKLKFASTPISLKMPYEVSDRRYVGLEHIRSWTGEIIPENVDEPPEGIVSLFEPGDILFGKLRPYLAKVALPNFPGACSTEALVLRPKRGIEPRFLRYVLSDRKFIDEVHSSTFGAKMPRASWEFIGSRKISTPDLGAQRAIADFLDAETSRIDGLISKKQLFINLLHESLQTSTLLALTQAGSENTQVSWLGSVPKAWPILKTKRVFRLVCDAAPENNAEELLSVYTDIGVRPRKDLEQRGNKASTTDGYWRVRKGDLVVNKLLAWMGAIGYSAYDGVTSPAYDILRPTCPVETRFYHYLFRTNTANNELKRWSRGIMDMRLRLYFEQLGNIPVPVPPLDQQRAIVSTIEGLEKQHDQIVSRTKAHISLLTEYRYSLISLALNGQLDALDGKMQKYRTNEREPITAETKE